MSGHELNELKSIADSLLLPVGFKLQAEESHPDVFGSYFCIYSRADLDIRYIWDGKDGVGYLEIKPAHDYSWRAFSSYVPESNLDSMVELARSVWPGEVAEAIGQSSVN